MPGGRLELDKGNEVNFKEKPKDLVIKLGILVQCF
jgi:hypothetical protein